MRCSSSEALAARAQFVGHIFGSRVQTVGALLPLLAKRAGLPDAAAPPQVWEEVKSEPAVMCDCLSHADILIVQAAVAEARASAGPRACLR